MTICEYFFNQYQKTHELTSYWAKETLKDISEKHQKGSLPYVISVFDNMCGAAYDYQFKNAGITLEQYRGANLEGFLAHREYSNWKARQLGQTQFYWLTKKGIKAMYKAYLGKW